MNQLTKAPLRSAKHLKKVKEMKKVETAIKWHERAREKRAAAAAAAFERKTTSMGAERYLKGLKDFEKRSLKKVRRDWVLGPLRPNHATGHKAQRHGEVNPTALRRPEIPVLVQKHRNEFREKRGLEPEYPIVVDDKKYFPIVEGDRVVMVKGWEPGRIGTVSAVSDHNHEVTIAGINEMYASGGSTKQIYNRPVLLEDVRLVVPYRITTQNAVGQSKDIIQDVIVDKVVMERHTTGIDPFTGIDYGKDEFPEEHRFDPATGVPIFKRYIAGTRSIIQWPWEQTETATQVESTPNTKEEVQKGRIRRSIDWVKGTASSATKAIATSKKQQEEEMERKKQEEDEKALSNIERGIKEAQEQPYPTSKAEPKREMNFDDTGRNFAEPTPETRSFYPTLVYPPFPNELSTELAEDIRIKSWAGKKDKSTSNTTTHDAVQKHKEMKQVAERMELEKLATMKTPMQLRWEVERAKKMREEKPLVQTDSLLLALGSHMQAKGIQLTPKRLKAAGEEVQVG